MGQLEVHSARLAIKQWSAGLLAYNLIRGVLLWAAATTDGVAANPVALAFAHTRRRLGHTRRGWQYPGTGERLLADVTATVPPRRQRPVPQTFPVLRGSRAAARSRLAEEQMKS